MERYSDALFMLDGIEWLKWLIGGVFFMLGIFMGWWKWSYRRRAKSVGSEKKLTLQKKEAPRDVDKKPSDLSTGEFGPIYEAEPDKIDDLQKINGIGKALRSKLYSLGIYKFEQIANWSESEAAAVSKRLHLVDQIERNQWREQAKSLLE